ncbi:hypothetical protein [Streptomyces sp. NPDC058254]
MKQLDEVLTAISPEIRALRTSILLLSSGPFTITRIERAGA